MEAQRLVYYPTLQTANDEVGPTGLPGVPQAYIGLATREAEGYGFYAHAVQNAAGSSDVGSSGQSQEERYADSLRGSAAQNYLAHLSGPDSKRVTVTLPEGGTTSVPAGGCRGEAERQIYGSIGNYIQITTGASLLTDQLSGAVMADPAFAAVVTKWSSCMAKRGYKYGSPESLWNQLADRIYRAPTLQLRNLEIKVSVADYICAESVALVSKVRKLQYDHARHLSQALASSLAQVTQIDERALKVAKALHLAG